MHIVMSSAYPQLLPPTRIPHPSISQNSLTTTPCHQIRDIIPSHSSFSRLPYSCRIYQRLGLVPTNGFVFLQQCCCQVRVCKECYARFETTHEVLIRLIGAVLVMQYSHNLGAGAAPHKLPSGMAFWGTFEGSRWKDVGGHVQISDEEEIWRGSSKEEKMLRGFSYLQAIPCRMFIHADGHKAALRSRCPSSIHQAAASLEDNTTHPLAAPDSWQY